MVAGVAAQEPVADPVAGADDEHRPLHPGIPLRRTLAEPLTHRPEAGAQRAGAEGGRDPARRSQRAIGRGRRVAVDGDTGAVLPGEVRRLPGRPAADEEQPGAVRFDLPPLAAQLCGLLAAEDSAEVAEP